MGNLNFFKILPLSAEKDEYTIVCGTMQATPKTFKTVKEAQSYIRQKPYELIFTLALVAIEAKEAMEKETKKTTAKENPENINKESK